MARKEALDWSDPGLAALVSRVAKSLGLIDWRVSQFDGRKIVGTRPDGSQAALHFEPVSATNAGQYRGWLAMNKQAWGRATGARPDQYKSYTVMAARGPDDAWWWGQAFDDDRLRLLEERVHWVRPGYGRLPPTALVNAVATPIIDLLQTSLWEDAPQCLHESIKRIDDDWECTSCGKTFEPVSA